MKYRKLVVLLVGCLSVSSAFAASKLPDLLRPVCPSAEAIRTEIQELGFSSANYALGSGCLSSGCDQWFVSRNGMFQTTHKWELFLGTGFGPRVSKDRVKEGAVKLIRTLEGPIGQAEYFNDYFEGYVCRYTYSAGGRTETARATYKLG